MLKLTCLPPKYSLTVTAASVTINFNAAKKKKSWMRFLVQEQTLLEVKRKVVLHRDKMLQ